MSERSFRANRKLGVAGAKTDTCFPQALDRITPERGVSTYTYQQYGRVMRMWEKRPSWDSHPGRHNAILAELYGMVATDLGSSYGDMVFEHALKACKIARILGELMASGYRTTIDLVNRAGFTHTVGVTQTDENLFRLVGYGVPRPFRGVDVSAEDIEHVVFNPGFLKAPYYPFQARNIAAIPAPEL